MKISNLEHIDQESISNIIFDWGGVITNIDYQATVQAFENLGYISFHERFSQIHGDDLFQRLEKGLAEPEELYKIISDDIGKSVSNHSFKKAWNAMILDTPPVRIKILKKLRNKYKIFLLSNTNTLHVNYAAKRFKNEHQMNFPSLFHKVYYSYEIGMRKPDVEIFEYVLTDSKLNADETLFIDDTDLNIESADSTGMISLHLNGSYTMEKNFRKWVD
ncbi:D-ribitol-5-phosphate phosphatase [subsurface metagenome]